MRMIIISLFFLFSTAISAQTTSTTLTETPEVGFSIVKTSKVSVQERLLKPDGAVFKKTDSNFSAFLIKHHQDYFLFDTGLGRHIEEQYEQDMPVWQRLFFKFDKPVISAKEQLSAAGFGPIKNIIISHSHWDHAGGVLDFPESQIHTSAEELEVIRHPTTGAGGTWASQIASKTLRWNTIAFKNSPYKGYEKSLDLYEDGSIVLVPMSGHTTGSIGMFLTTDNGKCYFFIGDVAWTVDALKLGASKFWAAGLIVDHDAKETQASLNQVREVLRKYPETIIVPAHDSTVQNALGYFPSWVK
jgi:glyoxylase-like metal-dependent hydrolase (beta-lactamase superfamily II)